MGGVSSCFCSRRESVNAARELRSAPSAGPGIIGIRWQGGARLTSDAQVSFVVLGQIRDSVRIHVPPYLLPTPVGEQPYFPQNLPGLQPVQLELLPIFSCRPSVSPPSREPHVHPS